MKWLFDKADGYIKTMKWQDLSLVKLCLFSIGLIVAGSIEKKGIRKLLRNIGILGFAASYIPLMSRFLPFLFRKEDVD
ncbi:MAG: permease of phosphate ABC transporter [Oscillospiraceae bacterium]|nr:permease of phosphate ABC transporter [Oscillospiraceae bacterium]